MTNFFNKFKNPYFWPIFAPLSQFLRQKKFPGKSDSVTHNFIWVSSIMPKFRIKLIIQSQENAQTDGQTDIPYLTGPFPLPPGV